MGPPQMKAGSQGGCTGRGFQHFNSSLDFTHFGKSADTSTQTTIVFVFPVSSSEDSNER